MAARNDAGNTERAEKRERAAQRMMIKLGVALERLDVMTTEGLSNETYITGINIKIRYDTHGDVIVVLKADSADGKLVGFNTADSPSSAVLGLVNRLDNGTLRWREDTPYNE